MQRHNAEHEERILGLAIGDEEQVRVRERTRAQIVACEHCLSYAYDVLADLPALRAALRPDGGAAPAPTPEGLELLERTLDEALQTLAAEDAARAERSLQRAEWVAALAALFRRGWGWEAVGLAAAAAAVAVFLLTSHDVTPPSAPRARLELAAARPVPEAFGRTQFSAARDALARGMGFAGGEPPSPFVRGYTLALLLDRSASGAEPSKTGMLARYLVEAASLDGRRLEAAQLDERSCRDLEPAGDGPSGCRAGMAAYRIVRDIELEGQRPDYVQALLRSPAAKELLEFAKGRLPTDDRATAFGWSVGVVNAHIQSGTASNDAEREAWMTIAGALLR